MAVGVVSNGKCSCEAIKKLNEIHPIELEEGEEELGDSQLNANNRWLLLMEPINALHASIILGAKVFLQKFYE